MVTLIFSIEVPLLCSWQIICILVHSTTAQKQTSFYVVHNFYGMIYVYVKLHFMGIYGFAQQGIGALAIN